MVLVAIFGGAHFHAMEVLVDPLSVVLEGRRMQVQAPTFDLGWYCLPARSHPFQASGRKGGADLAKNRSLPGDVTQRIRRTQSTTIIIFFLLAFGNPAVG